MVLRPTLLAGTALVAMLGACGQVFDLGSHPVDAALPDSGDGAVVDAGKSVADAGDTGIGADANEPPAGTAVTYSTVAELEALLVGHWGHAFGPAQLFEETAGIELTSGHDILLIQRDVGGNLTGAIPPTKGPTTWAVATGDAGVYATFDGAAGSSTPQLVFVEHGMVMGMILFQAQWTRYSLLTTDGGW